MRWLLARTVGVSRISAGKIAAEVERVGEALPALLLDPPRAPPAPAVRIAAPPRHVRPVNPWESVLAARGAVACLDALLRSMPPDPGVLALEAVYGSGEPVRGADWIHGGDIPAPRRAWLADLATALGEHAPPDWLALVKGEGRAAA